MAKDKSLLSMIFRKLFAGKIEKIESALENDPKIIELTKKIDESLEELEEAVDDYIDTEMYD